MMAPCTYLECNYRRRTTLFLTYVYILTYVYDKHKLLIIPRVTSKKLASRSFSVHTWYNLPDNLRRIETLDQFKIDLKTHLYNEYFVNIDNGEFIYYM